MTNAMRATTIDVCQPGFERLRSQSEFILLAHPREGDSPSDLKAEWLADIQRCERPDGFDYDAAREAVETFCLDASGYLANVCSDAPPADESEELTAFLYIESES